jgi:hypothetical protein
MRIKIWCPEDESEEDAKEIEVGYDLTHALFWFRVRAVMRDFMDRYYSFGDLEASTDIHVRAGDVLKKYTVTVEMAPTFTVLAQKPA